MLKLQLLAGIVALLAVENIVAFPNGAPPGQLHNWLKK